MKKIINKKVYDTENAELIHKYTYSYFGSEEGYEESIFMNPEGFYFLYTNGGAASKYPEEKIKSVSKVRAMQMIEAYNS